MWVCLIHALLLILKLLLMQTWIMSKCDNFMTPVPFHRWWWWWCIYLLNSSWKTFHFISITTAAWNKSTLGSIEPLAVFHFKGLDHPILNIFFGWSTSVLLRLSMDRGNMGWKVHWRWPFQESHNINYWTHTSENFGSTCLIIFVWMSWKEQS